jgi:hypothetical protein
MKTKAIKVKLTEKPGKIYSIKPNKNGIIKNQKTGLVEVWKNGKLIGAQG